MPNLLRGFESKGIDCKDLVSRIETPIEFRFPKGGTTSLDSHGTFPS